VRVKWKKERERDGMKDNNMEKERRDGMYAPAPEK
jgi:hypothetical protein